jgi:hypothetical protein
VPCTRTALHLTIRLSFKSRLCCLGLLVKQVTVVLLFLMLFFCVFVVLFDGKMGGNVGVGRKRKWNVLEKNKADEKWHWHGY